MKTLRNLILFLIVLGLLVMVFFMFYSGKTSNLQPSGKPQNELIAQGEYLARAGDCVACHTASNGSFAGGLPLDSGTIVGTIFSTNITPDKETGIGNYTLQDFDNAVRYGIREDGASLYPAMPFPSFAVVRDEDVEAMYAYFMSLEPVKAQNKPVTGSWPFSMRWPINAWRLMFSPKVESYQPMTGMDERVARGAYLVQGLGHCGSCHTPRNITMSEKAYSEINNSDFLAGASQPMEGWIAGNLRGDDLRGLGRVSQEQLYMLLRTGRNDTSAVFGSMSDVIVHSLQYLNDEDIQAIVQYLKTLPPVNPAGPSYTYDNKVSLALFNGDASAIGARTYIDNCAACHRTDGKGYAQTFPALAGNQALQEEQPDSLINVILQGQTLHGVSQAPTAYTMPGFAWRLNDQEVADVLTFIRTSWGNQGKPVSASAVAYYRAKLSKEEIAYQAAQSNPAD